MIFIFVLFSVIHLLNCQFDWQIKDSFDEIQTKMDLINGDNCETKQIFELTLPQETVPQIPSIRKIDPIFANRTMLRIIHDAALNRAFFYSFIYAKANDTEQPGLMYYYASQIADISANYYLNGSGIVFSPNTSYPNFYRDFFNKTLNYFAPYTYRTDDYLDPFNPNRLPTLNTVKAIDLGADYDGSSYLKYDRDEYWKVNEWYRQWLPDDSRDLSKMQYHIALKYLRPYLKGSRSDGNNTMWNIIYKEKPLWRMRVEEENFAFFGPPDPAENPGPVKWTLPYFDCRRSNKWTVTAISPVIDYFPRHTPWKHLRKHKYVAVSTADIDFNRIDINPCPKMRGNEDPNLFAGIARCKNTTVCEPLIGHGFRRGGYQCVCKPGYRYPDWQPGPFLGEFIEKATQFEYENGYDCWKNERIEYYPNPSTFEETSFNPESGSNYAKRDLRNQQESFGNVTVKRRRQKRNSYETTAHAQLEKFLNIIRLINPGNCHSMSYKTLVGDAYDPLIDKNRLLSENINYQAKFTFEAQMRIARRTAHFLSYFLQRIDPTETLTERLTDQYLTVDQIYGEVLSNAMSGYKLIGSGIFFDIDAFQARDGTSRPFFAPYAYKTEDSNFVVVDKAANLYNELPDMNDDEGDDKSADYYAFDSGNNDNRDDDAKDVYYFDYAHKLQYFKDAKEKYGTLRGTDRLIRYHSYIHVRANKEGTNSMKYENYPDVYYGSDEGFWYGPYYNCKGVGPKTWILTYYTPFFGRGDLPGTLTFKGIVTIDVELSQMDINQCPDEYGISNPFKGSDKCHFTSQYCVFLPGKGFRSGGYKCECRQGFEYPYNLPKTYFEGDEMESEYQKKILNRTNRYDLFKCRIAGTTKVKPFAFSINVVLNTLIAFTISYVIYC